MTSATESVMHMLNAALTQRKKVIEGGIYMPAFVCSFFGSSMANKLCDFARPLFVQWTLRSPRSGDDWPAAIEARDVNAISVLNHFCFLTLKYHMPGKIQPN